MQQQISDVLHMFYGEFLNLHSQMKVLISTVTGVCEWLQVGCGLQCIYCCALQAFTLAGGAPPWCHITGRVVR